VAKTHPHIDSPSEPQLAELVAARPEHVREAYLAAHRLMVGTLPKVRFSVDTVDGQIGYGARQYGYNGWGMAAVSPHSKWATLVLLGGARLPDPSGLLAGTSSMRHVKLTSAAQVASSADDLRELIQAAARLNDPEA
jgi:hypothetical protein